MQQASGINHTLLLIFLRQQQYTKARRMNAANCIDMNEKICCMQYVADLMHTNNYAKQVSSGSGL